MKMVEGELSSMRQLKVYQGAYREVSPSEGRITGRWQGTSQFFNSAEDSYICTVSNGTVNLLTVRND